MEHKDYNLYATFLRHIICRQQAKLARSWLKGPVNSRFLVCIGQEREDNDITGRQLP